MVITLTREINLNETEAILAINRETFREDIQEYLRGKGYDDKLIDNGIKNYLKSVNIYDDNFNLTQYGRVVLETGILKVKEKGKYRIWIDGRRIMLIKRVAPADDTRGMVINKIMLNKEGHFCLPYDNENEFFRFEIQNEKINGTEPKSAGFITETIEITDDNKSKTSFSGKMVKDKTLDENIEFKNIPMYRMLEMIFDDLWNANTKRARIQYKSLQGAEEIESFETFYRGNWKPYTTQIKRLPVEPYNIEEARIWRDKLLEVELNKRYLHPDDFYRCASEISSMEGFKSYETEMGIPDIAKRIEQLEPAKKSGRTAAYWHLAAPMDLNVGIPQRMKIDSFFLKKDEKTSLENLVLKFGSINAEKIFYYDKYVVNYYQQRSVSAFLKCFGVFDVCVITDMKPAEKKFNNYILTQKQFTLEDINDIYQNKNDAPHDRFIAFKNGNNLDVWTSTNSIDFIRFNIKGDIPPGTEGNILNSVTYTRVNPAILDSVLAEYIKEN